MQNMSKKKDKKPIKKQKEAANLSLENNRWLIPALTAISACWFSIILNRFGIKWELQQDVNGSRVLTTFGIITSIIIVVLPIAIACIKERRIVNINEELTQNRNQRTLFNIMLNSLIDIDDYKLNISSHTIRSIITPDASVSNSENILAHIMSQIANCVAFSLSTRQRRINTGDLSINLIYSIDGMKEWTFCGNCQRGLQESDICVEGSTMHYLLEQKEDFAFFNRKQDAFNLNAYIVDGKDVRDSFGHYIGSIAGYKIRIRNSKVDNIVALLFISSYSRAFVSSETQTDSSDEAITNVEANLREIIIKNFERSIKIELVNIASCIFQKSLVV